MGMESNGYGTLQFKKVGLRVPFVTPNITPMDLRGTVDEYIQTKIDGELMRCGPYA